ncbi:MAG: PD40 domain-containing protein [Bacteroidetes bacterium]|nr:PD40 domain-containing protein [Bacteroidota bacterium]
MKIFYTILFITNLSFINYSQNNIKNDLKQADNAFEKADFLSAYKIYSKLLERTPNNEELNFKAGSCLFNINKMDTGSLKYFELSKPKVAESHFYLGKIYLFSGQCRRALEEFYFFKANNTEEMFENTEVNTWIKMSESAIIEEGKKNNFIIKNLGSNVNSQYADYVPLIWNTNGSLIFTSRRPDSKGGLTDPYGRYFEDIYISAKETSGWNKPVSISDEINTQTHDACVAISSSGNELMIYRTDEKQTGGDFYICKHDGIKWGAPQKMGPEINSEYLEASACFSPQGDEIIFSSNRPGGYGGKDLYKIRKFMDGTYSLPRNLGPEINTIMDEDAPFIDNDNILYFSSRGHNSIGEYDIFKTEYNPETNRWEKTQNMGMPINSTNDDIYFIKTADQQNALFTSRREGGYGDADIYQTNFNETTQLITYCKFTSDVPKSELKDLQLLVYDVESGKLEGKYRLNKNYMSMVLVTTYNKMYKIIIECEGIEPIVKNIVFTPDNKEMNFELFKSTK